MLLIVGAAWATFERPSFFDNDDDLIPPLEGAFEPLWLDRELNGLAPLENCLMLLPESGRTPLDGCAAERLENGAEV